jgi:two-component system sensor histidine kinase and response regulator WspE
MLRHKHIDLLLRGVDLLGRIAQTPELEVGQWADDKKPEVDAFLSALACVLEGKEEVASLDGDVPPAPALTAPQPPQPAEPRLMATASPGCASDRVLRVTAGMNHMLHLAGGSLVEQLRLPNRCCGSTACTMMRDARQVA